MIETSTPESQNLYKDKVREAYASEDLAEDDQYFYDHIKPELSMIIKDPSQQTVDNLMNYSRSL